MEDPFPPAPHVEETRPPHLISTFNRLRYLGPAWSPCRHGHRTFFSFRRHSVGVFSPVATGRAASRFSRLWPIRPPQRVPFLHLRQQFRFCFFTSNRWEVTSKGTPPFVPNVSPWRYRTARLTRMKKPPRSIPFPETLFTKC